MIAYSVSAPTLQPKKKTCVLAASLRSALRIRCWCWTTALRLCYLRWCRQHRILMLFQDNGTRLRQAGRLRQISQDSMRASRQLPGPRTRVSCCTFRAAYARSSPFTRCAASSLPSFMSSQHSDFPESHAGSPLPVHETIWTGTHRQRPQQLLGLHHSALHRPAVRCLPLGVGSHHRETCWAVFHCVGRRANDHAQVLEPCPGHRDTACRCRARLTSSMRFI